MELQLVLAFSVSAYASLHINAHPSTSAPLLLTTLFTGGYISINNYVFRVALLVSQLSTRLPFSQYELRFMYL